MIQISQEFQLNQFLKASRSPRISAKPISQVWLWTTYLEITWGAREEGVGECVENADSRALPQTN